MTRTSTASSGPSLPFSLLSRYLTFSDRDQCQWWQNKGQLLSQMLQDCGYNEHQQYQYLTLFHHDLAPALGAWPAPQVGQQDNTLPSDAGELELSLTFKGQNTFLRIAFEPFGSMKGAEGRDPSNQAPIQSLLKNLEKLEGVQLCLDHYHTLVNHLTLSDRDQRELETTNKKSLAERMPSWTQHTLALNLIDGDVYPQLYFHPQLKSLATDKPVSEMLFDALRATDSDIAPALAMLHEYLHKAPATTVPAFLSCDLIEPSAASRRIFLAETNITWDRIQGLWTLRGKLDDSPQRVQPLKTLWDILKIRDGIRGNDECPLLITMALSKNAPFIETQIAFPMEGKDELSIGEAVSHFLAGFWGGDQAIIYPKALRSY
ncbi:hypothetical protein CNMCM7691_002143 [Aspergillus felis]|uniref:Dimethylallyl tryptophan synthase n=1 Tax=Aspergillus felis TaxID=1287682 RepID=A0A8H6R2P3_9EURO|nr:hypothetical protein CNMCM7691_002143 [Aspergillus felis]